MTARHYINVGTLAGYWRQLLNRNVSDLDAWEQLLGQIAKGYLVCDPPLPTDPDRLSLTPPLRWGSRIRSPPLLKINIDDSVPLDAVYFRAALAIERDSRSEVTAALGSASDDKPVVENKPLPSPEVDKPPPKRRTRGPSPIWAEFITPSHPADYR